MLSGRSSPAAVEALRICLQYCCQLQPCTAQLCFKSKPQSKAQERRIRQSTHTAAKRVSKEEAAAGEWAALLKLEGEEAPADGITVEQLNEICSKGVKLMLRGDARHLLDYRDELSDIGKSFTDRADLPGALFIYVLYKMTENTIIDEADNLEGMYADAFTRVFSILEDSGWKMLREGEEEDGEVSVDDLPMLNYMS